MRIAIDTQGKEIVNAQKEKPRHGGAFLHFNYWRREPESNRPKRLCRPLHNRFAIAPQADRNLAADSLICLVDKLQVHQTKREALLPLMYGAGDEARTRDLNLGKVALYQLSYSRIALLRNALHSYFAKLNSPNLQRAASKIWSGRRGSNSRPQPWQGCALPTELLPRIDCLLLRTTLYCTRCLKPRASEKRDYGETTETCQPL